MGMLNNLPVKWKMLLAAIIPITAMCGFAATSLYEQFTYSRQMERLEKVSTFSASSSKLIHELQKERGRSAGYIGSAGAPEYKKPLLSQRRQTDAAIQAFLTELEHDLTLFGADEQQEHLELVRGKLGDLAKHRQQVDNLTLGLQQTVQPYTATIDGIIDLVVDSSRNQGADGTATTMSAVLSLMQAKENAGLERAVGSNVLASRDISPEKHQKVMELIARQDGLFDEYRHLSEDTWDNRLDRMLQSEESLAVKTARDALLASGYSGSLPDMTGTQWFDLTTKRIDAMMDLETELVAHLGELATNRKQQAEMVLNMVLIASLLVVIGSIVISLLLVRSVVKPIEQITRDLDELAHGNLDVQINGHERSDEIGILAGAAQTFLEMSRQREQIMEETSAIERDALQERRRVLHGMASEVETATHQSVSQVVALAEQLSSLVNDMQVKLKDAGSTTEAANAATSQTLEETSKAAELADELSRAIGEVAESVVNGDRLARETVIIAEESRVSVETLEVATQQINDFVRIISELADQTNLLALNATIESARAGEAGRGFAVVAAEIKELASQTTRSASEITERVNSIQSSTKDAVSNIERISTSINSLGEVTSSIAAAVEQQRMSTSSFTEFLGKNRQSIESVAERVAGLSDVSRAVTESSNNITDEVAKMTKVSRDASESIPLIVQKAVTAADSRREPRQVTDTSVILSADNVSRPVRLKDVSEHGARLDARTEGNVRISLPDDMGDVEGKAAWTSDNETGVEFDGPLDNSLIMRLIREQERKSVA